MAINFPDSPSAGDPHTEAGVTWTYDGEKWVSNNTAAPAALWTRAGTVLSPATAGDDVTTTGDLSAADGTFSGDINCTGAFLGTKNIVLNRPGTDSPSGALVQYTYNNAIVYRIGNNGNVTLGDPTSPNISLAADGAGNFNCAGVPLSTYRQVNVGGNSIFNAWSNVGSGKTIQCQITSDGKIRLRDTTPEQLSSERRLKENIVAIDADTAWKTIKSVPYYAYNFIGSDSITYGPMADEVPAEMVIETDMSDDEGVIRTYNNGMLQARLYTALQTALTRIEALEAEVQALKGGSN